LTRGGKWDARPSKGGGGLCLIGGRSSEGSGGLLSWGGGEADELRPCCVAASHRKDVSVRCH